MSRIKKLNLCTETDKKSITISMQNDPTRSSTEALNPESRLYVMRLARAINLNCRVNGFYSSFGVTPEMECGSRKFCGHVKVIRGRLMATEVCGDVDYSVDLTGATSVEGNGNGTIYPIG